ncbi:hypothetical protein RB623_06805 [Mesorhizobium sp. LHD-90]|uniref:hypothetical protein n=1 Tax=Mesorhizobium sp. LHD-90 TaxID=3071414 RepID=UPI0027DF0A3C|nr:hypothetical protein [Mesorhizobium sp. LHD-90]MDQ6433760.1 hypothetical protein [Mesorhizobium sp. LHD-90]
MSIKDTIQLMKSVGWTPQLFAESFNSMARLEAHAAYLRTKQRASAIPQVDLATAERFLANGTRFGGVAEDDLLDRWIARRSGQGHVARPMGGTTVTFFDPPMEKQTLSNVSPPLLLPLEVEESQDVITLQNVTNERARAKALGIRGIG